MAALPSAMAALGDDSAPEAAHWGGPATGVGSSGQHSEATPPLAKPALGDDSIPVAALGPQWLPLAEAHGQPLRVLFNIAVFLCRHAPPLLLQQTVSPRLPYLPRERATLPLRAAPAEAFVKARP